MTNPVEKKMDVYRPKKVEIKTSYDVYPLGSEGMRTFASNFRMRIPVNEPLVIDLKKKI